MRIKVRNLKWLLPSFSISAEDTPSKKGPSAAIRAAPGLTGTGWKPGSADLRLVQSCGLSSERLAGEKTPPTTAGSGPRAGPVFPRPLYIPYLRRRASVSARVDVTFPRRGRYAQDGLRISTRFPFGLIRKSRPASLGQEILVLPSIEPTEEFYEILPLVSGEAESIAKGRGHDLYGIRDYRPTDTARHVDWRATAKAQRLKVREFTREDERRVALVFDARLASADEKTLEHFEKAVTFCACLGWHFYEINAQMQFISESLETPMASAGQVIYPMLEHLAVVRPIVASGPGCAATPHDPSPLADAPVRANRVAPTGSTGSSRDILATLSSAADSFNIILTFQPRGSIPTSLWTSSYVVFGDSL